MTRVVLPLPSKGYLDEILNYDPDTGLFYWKVQRSRNKAGDAAGMVASDGYIKIGIDGRQYGAHRLAYKIVTGNDPTDLIDHRDGNKANNKWENLREATARLNNANSKPRSNSRSGVRCVHYNKSTGKWVAKVTYKTIEEAEEAVKILLSVRDGTYAFNARNID